jgi:ribosomal-protein-alanine N-acetyltransferase
VAPASGVYSYDAHVTSKGAVAASLLHRLFASAEAGEAAYNGGVETILRPFRRRDFDALWKIDQKCFPPGIAYSKHELSDYIQRRKSFTLVAEAVAEDPHLGDPEDAPSGIVGFIVAEASARGIGHIITVDVVPGARRTGAGSKLLGTTEDWLRTAKCFRVRLEAAVDNEPALAFYKRHGYSVVGRISQYYETGLDAYSLEKAL